MMPSASASDILTSASQSLFSRAVTSAVVVKRCVRIISCSGQGTVILPWKDQWALPSTEVRPQQSTMARIQLVGLMDRQQQFVAAVELVGRTDLPSSLVTIERGERARIRAAAIISRDWPGLSTSLAPIREVDLEARFSITGKPCFWSAPVLSRNALRVRIPGRD